MNSKNYRVQENIEENENEGNRSENKSVTSSATHREGGNEEKGGEPLI